MLCEPWQQRQGISNHSKNSATHLVLQSSYNVGEALSLVLKVFQCSLALLHHAVQLVVKLFLHLALLGCRRLFESFKLLHGCVFFGVVLGTVPAQSVKDTKKHVHTCCHTCQEQPGSWPPPS